MSKIKNGGLDQYGKVKSLNGMGGERVKLVSKISQFRRVGHVQYNDGI